MQPPKFISLQLHSLESGITNDLAHLAALALKGPLPLVSIRKGDIPVRTPEDDNRLARVVQNLASLILLLNQGPNTQLHRLKRTTAPDWWLLLTRALSKDSLGPCLSGLVAEDHAKLGGVRSNLLECRVTDDLMDLAWVAESPRALVAVGEGDVRVLATTGHDRLVGGVEDLAAVVFLRHVFAQLDFDGLEGAKLSRGLRDPLTCMQDILSAGLAEVAKDDTDVVVVVVLTWRCKCSCGREGGEDHR